jgi:hypothetical protein
MSATGSVIIVVFSSPTGFDQTWNLTRERQLAEAQAAQPELSQETAGPPAGVAPIVLSYVKLRLAQRLCNGRLLGQIVASY